MRNEDNNTQNKSKTEKHMATKKHSWNYDNIGGSTRVRIKTGADISNLAELDLKKWTVLSCPTAGLGIDEVNKNHPPGNKNAIKFQEALLFLRLTNFGI